MSYKKEEKAKPAMKEMPEADAHEMAEEKGEFDKYELECAVDTLQKAMEIKNNAALMKALEPMLEKKKKAINSIDDLRAVAKEKGITNRMDD